MKSKTSYGLVLLMLVCLTSTAFAKSMELTSAKVYLNQGDKHQALTWLENADQKNTREAEVYTLMVEIYGDLERYEEMNAAFERISECKDKERKLKKFLERADSYIKSLWVPKANKAIEIIDGIQEQLAAGDTAAVLDAFAQARKGFGQALEILPTSADLQQYLGNTYVEEFNLLHGATEQGFEVLSGGVPYFDGLVEQFPDSLQYVETLVQVLFTLRDYDRVYTLTSGLLESHPDESFLLTYAGKSRIKQAVAVKEEQPELAAQYKKEAVELMKRSRALDPEDPMLAFNLALLFQELGIYKEALETYASTVELAGERTDLKVESYKMMGYICLEKVEPNDPVKAASYFDEALLLAPNDNDVKNNLGVALIRAGGAENIERGSRLIEEATGR